MNCCEHGKYYCVLCPGCVRLIVDRLDRIEKLIDEAIRPWIERGSYERESFFRIPGKETII